MNKRSPTNLGISVNFIFHHLTVEAIILKPLKPLLSRGRR